MTARLPRHADLAPLSDGDLLGQEPALLRWAVALTKDAAEAQALVDQTLTAARAERSHGDRAGLFQTFRQTYHSVARGRVRRPVRDATVTALAGAPAEAAAAWIA